MDEVTSQQALDTVAAEWRKITDELGADRQRAAYRMEPGVLKKVVTCHWSLAVEQLPRVIPVTPGKRATPAVTLSDL